MDLIIGSEYSLVELETCVAGKTSRPRVRPLKPFPDSIKVEFPRLLREKYPIGTRFRADVIACQKTNKKDGSLRGSLYLRAIPETIILVENFTPKLMIMALLKASSVSGRSYEYVEYASEEVQVDLIDSFQLLRDRAIRLSSDIVLSKVRETSNRARNTIIKLYAQTRSRGFCEACDEPAPFIRKNNGQPYLEVHHIQELSKDGPDSPENVAAICPNCHARVTYGADASHYNGLLLSKVREVETLLGLKYK